MLRARARCWMRRNWRWAAWSVVLALVAWRVVVWLMDHLAPP